jgi:hypothetical protein
MQSEQCYLSQDKLALLFIRGQTVGHSVGLPSELVSRER